MRERRAWHAAHGGLRVGLAALTLLVVALVAWRAWGGRPQTPPPATAPTAAAFVPAAEPAPVAAVERRAADATGTAVFGRASDGSDESLVGWIVELRVRGEPSAEPILTPSAAPAGVPLAASFGRRPSARLAFPTAVTDTAGAFVFEAVDPGAYVVQLRGAAAATVDVDVATGERRRVDLRLGADRCAVVVVLTRNGTPLPDRQLEVTFADGSTHGCLPQQGEYHFAAPPGSHRLAVACRTEHARTTTLLRRLGHTLAVLPFVVPVGRASLRLSLQVPTQSLEVVASDGSTAPFPYLTFLVEGKTEVGRDAATYEFVGADGRVGHLDELPPGDWRVTARSPYFDAEPQDVRVSQGSGVHRIVLNGRRTTVVWLDLRTAAGQPLPLSTSMRRHADRLPPLRCGAREIPCGDIGKDLVPRRDHTVPGFAGVPPGPAEWPLVDREVDGAVQFVMFEPLPAPRLEVVGRGQNVLTVCVEPRAFVDLVACHRGGMEAPFARIRVFRGERRVVPIGEPDRSRWQAFLPPGEYRVEIEYGAAGDAPGERREHVLFVQRRDVNLRLRR